MTFRAKAIILSIVLICISISSIVVNVITNTTAKSQVSHVTDQILPGVSEVATLNSGTKALLSLVLRYMLVTSEEEMEVLDLSIKGIQEGLVAAENRFGKLDLGGDVKQSYEETKVLADQFNVISAKIVNYAKERMGGEAQTTMDTELLPVADTLAQKIQTINDKLDQIAVTAQSEVSGAMDGAVAAILTMGILSVLTSLFFANTAVGITKPLRKATSVAANIAVGDLDVDIATKDLMRKDEVGTLLGTFQKMLTTIKDKTNKISIISDGDLSVDIELASDRDALGLGLKKMLESFRKLIGEVTSSVEQVAVSSRNLSESSRVLASGSTEQAAALEEISATIAEISNKTAKSAEDANKANELVLGAEKAADENKVAVASMNEAMSGIAANSKEIQKVMRVIDDIAFQTNLLALNAAVEAARAGQYGKGFAVVAGEVRNLAGRSAVAAKETSDMVEVSIRDVESGVGVAKATADALEHIVKFVNETASLISGIAKAAQDQDYSVGQVNEGLKQIDSVTQRNATSAQDTSSAAEEMSRQAIHLRELVTQFVLPEHNTNNSVNLDCDMNSEEDEPEIDLNLVA